jgi:hypothetical protein
MCHSVMLPETKAHKMNNNSSGSTESTKVRVIIYSGFMLAIPYRDALHSKRQGIQCSGKLTKRVQCSIPTTQYTPHFSSGATKVFHLA